MAYQSVLNKKKSHWGRNLLLIAFGLAAADAYIHFGPSLPGLGDDDGHQVINHSTTISCESSEGDKAAITFDKAARKLSVDTGFQTQTLTVSPFVGSIDANHLISGGGTWTCKDDQGRQLADGVKFKF
jgi:hypothetical protein